MKNASFVGIVVGSVLALAALPAFAGGGGQDTNQQEPASDQQVQSNGNYTPPQTGEANYGSNPNQQQGNIPQSNGYNGQMWGAQPQVGQETGAPKQRWGGPVNQ